MPPGTTQDMRVVHVAVPAGAGARYDVTVRPGLLADLPSALPFATRPRKAAVVTDTNVGNLHAAAAIGSLRRAGIEPIVATLPAGEHHKTLADVLPVFDRLLAAGIDRGTPVIALGGGVVGDMAGFVAATVLRGVPLIQAPTTLLSMVDASIGGKTGVNHAVGKNLIGAFKQPDAVLIDPLVLRTLPPGELRSGLAECIKHEIIRDADGFEALERNIARALALDIGYLAELIAHNVAIKARVVEADPLERGERAHLNFGHTFGHAVETVSGYKWSHGQCVALGMIAAAHVAVRLGMLDEASRGRIVSLIAAAGLPTGGADCELGAVVAAMGFDKKVTAGRLRLVLPDRIGHVVVRDDVPDALVREAVAQIGGR